MRVEDTARLLREDLERCVARRRARAESKGVDAGEDTNVPSCAALKPTPAPTPVPLPAVSELASPPASSEPAPEVATSPTSTPTSLAPHPSSANAPKKSTTYNSPQRTNIMQAPQLSLRPLSLKIPRMRAPRAARPNTRDFRAGATSHETMCSSTGHGSDERLHCLYCT